MAHAVTAPNAAAEALLRLVADASGLQHLNVTLDATSGDVRFTAADGTPAFGAATACRWLASLGGSAAQLLGDTPEQAAKVRGGMPNWGWGLSAPPPPPPPPPRAGSVGAQAFPASPCPPPTWPCNSLLCRLPSGSASAPRCSR